MWEIYWECFWDLHLWRKGREQDWAEGEVERQCIAHRALKLGEPCRVVPSWGGWARPFRPQTDHSLDVGLDLGELALFRQAQLQRGLRAGK